MTMLEVGESAPNISGTDIISGGQIALSDYSGKVICLAFVEYGCPICALQLLRLQNLWIKYRDDGVRIMASLRPVSDPTQARERTWLAGLTAGGITFPVLRDPELENVIKYHGYGERYYPMLFIIDCKKVIFYSHPRPTEEELMDKHRGGHAEEEPITEGHILDAIWSCSLKIGSEGFVVKVLQCILNSAGASPALTIDGLFGPETKTAVMAFQESHALVKDGIVRPITWAALLNPLLLKNGSSGSAVKALQIILNTEVASPGLTIDGMALTIDGIFGPKTKTKVIAFQQSRGLVQDGIVGPKTWKALIRSH
jgi:peptidoglycan hydrolase-like protein with peptidoglycan-binding domain/peroxiredoxin